MLRIFLILLLLPFAVAAAPPESSPREGYIQTPDGVRLFYKVVGRGPARLIVVHGGPGNSLSSVLPDYAAFEKN